MRDGTTRPTPHTTWMPPGIQVAHWRRHSRLFDLRQLTEGARGLVLSRRLLAALLEELHVSDDFDTLAGPVAGLPSSEFPRLLAIAVLLRTQLVSAGPRTDRCEARAARPECVGI